MKTKLTKLERAIKVFKARVDNLLLGMGARLLLTSKLDDEYALQTPVGPLRIKVQDTAVIFQFASAYGGEIATLNDSNPYTGKWPFYFPQDADTLLALSTLQNIREPLERILKCRPGDHVRGVVEKELADAREEADDYHYFMERCHANGWLTIDPAATGIMARSTSRKPRKPKPKKAAARKPAAKKHARPKRRSRV